MLCSLGKTSNLVLLVLQEHVIMYTCLQHQGTCRYVFGHTLRSKVRAICYARVIVMTLDYISAHQPFRLHGLQIKTLSRCLLINEKRSTIVQ